jgi:hypothetical protein
MYRYFIANRQFIVVRVTQPTTTHQFCCHSEASRYFPGKAILYSRNRVSFFHTILNSSLIIVLFSTQQVITLQVRQRGWTNNFHDFFFLIFSKVCNILFYFLTRRHARTHANTHRHTHMHIALQQLCWRLLFVTTHDTLFKGSNRLQADARQREK